MSLQEHLWLLGRALLGALFVVSGVRHFFIFGGVAQAIAARGVPQPQLVLALGSAFQTVAGVLLIVGVLVPVAALGLVVFTVLASLMLLNFWGLQGEARANAITGWLSNVAIIGGLLMAAARGS
jgi:putative oxidoreductase